MEGDDASSAALRLWRGVRRPRPARNLTAPFNPGREGLDELHGGVQIDKTVNAEPGPSHQR
jgi:hypothetical protein